MGSFGLSVWVYNDDGQLLTTSDDILATAINQGFFWPESVAWPGIQVETPFYAATWLPVAPGEWKLELSPAGDFGGQLALVLRSVGPAGGPVTNLEWDGIRLRVNEQWQLTPSPRPDVQVGHEGDPGWLAAAGGATSWQGDDGWGYARMLLPANTTTEVSVVRAGVDFSPGAEIDQASRRLNLALPDATFLDSLDAQVAHLQMSLVGDETRPGDPVNYPLAWQRDAAYIVFALARAGRVDLATDLADYVAEHDFFGGFGAEADAPGLAIWALNEIARQRNDPDYDRHLWPHIARKAALIEQMLAAEETVFHEFSGPVVPALAGDPVTRLVADPAVNGLINGRMDHHRPLLYVNAVSYRGLRDAADFAGRLGYTEEAARWQAAADDLQQAWQATFYTPEAGNERTYVSGLWPSGIVGPELLADYENNLEQRWQTRRTPAGGFQDQLLWTYFEVGEAHQWLYLDRPDRVWPTLSYFWENQNAPGLFTWWEGSGEENSFNQWEKVRGWVSPPYVSPHHWTTAEMLLLQLEMLAYVRPDGAVVVGSGVPESWLAEPLHAGPLPLAGGSVEWEWAGRELLVRLDGELETVVPGPAFAGRPLRIE